MRPGDSKGYRTGGFNANAPTGFQEFQPESLDNVEIGVKTDQNILGMKSRLNLAAFYGFYDNIQVQVTSAVPNPSGGPPLLQVLTQNAATAHISGVEAEFTIVPVESVELDADVAYDYNKYDQWQSLNSAGQPQDLSGTPFQENPRWMTRIRGTYYLPIDESRGKLSISATWSYQSSQNNTAQLPVLPAYITPGFDDLDLSLDWKDVWGEPGLDATVYGTNVLGNVMTNGPFGVYSALGIFGITPKAPPMWAVRLRYSFGGQGG
ncbi:MAG TPA: TonB-dependent receptor [Alphaproteobacteria bacterium]|nr:TonB-dependent receptor [Alphaproteobacteria bacterium]